MAAVNAGARAQVDDIVGRENCFLVMLDDNHSVADIAQCLQRDEQALIVTLMQADRRLVQDIHDAGQPGADLAR